MEKFQIYLGLIILLFITIWFYVSLHTTMNLISKKNRQMSGSYVWYNLVPFLGIFWPLIFNSCLAKSIENEFKDKGIDEKVNLYSGTLVYPVSILFLITLVYSTGFNSFDSGNLYLIELFGFSTLSFWIGFWVRISELKKILQGRQLNYNRNALYSMKWALILLLSMILAVYFYKKVAEKNEPPSAKTYPMN